MISTTPTPPATLDDPASPPAGVLTCSFVTLGCKINFHDTQAIREAVVDLGYHEVAAPAGVDLVVVNACSVTAAAADQGVAAVRRLVRNNPDATVIVTGCMTQEDRRRIEEIPQVSYIVGNEEKDQIPALLSGSPLAPTAGRRSRAIFNLSISRFTGRTRAFLKIHDGCDSFCSYCIIPFLRGKSRSRAPADVLAEAERLAAAGHREVVLTGIHLSQFGRDLGSETKLVDLLRALRAIPGIDRVRLSSIGEGAFSDELIELFQSDPGCCPFFHIPLQSGSDSVLVRMRRDYTVSEYFDAVDRVRAALPHAMLSTDLMVGFPGETEEEFNDSLDACRRARFAHIHLFPYSPRPGTRAARMDGHVPPAVRGSRMARARAVEAELAAAERRHRLGAQVDVLVEDETEDRAWGLSREGLRVGVARGAGESLWNHEVRAWITGEENGSLIAARERP